MILFTVGSRPVHTLQHQKLVLRWISDENEKPLCLRLWEFGRVDTVIGLDGGIYA